MLLLVMQNNSLDFYYSRIDYRKNKQEKLLLQLLTSPTATALMHKFGVISQFNLGLTSGQIGTLNLLRDWSLITGRGGYKTGGGWHVKFNPYERGGGAEKVLAMLKGGAQKVLGQLEVLPLL